MANKDLRDLITSTVLELDSLEKKPLEEEVIFLNSLRDRLHIFFEALQSDELVDGKKKLDITINYLEYMLSIIELRLKRI